MVENQQHQLPEGRQACWLHPQISSTEVCVLSTNMLKDETPRSNRQEAQIPQLRFNSWYLVVLFSRIRYALRYYTLICILEISPMYQSLVKGKTPNSCCSWRKKVEVALFTRRQGHKKHLRPKMISKIKVGNWFIWFNQQETHWLGIWMCVHLTLKEHHNRWMEKARAAEARHWTLTKTYTVVPESIRVGQVARIQQVALCGSKVWWDPQ